MNLLSGAVIDHEGSGAVVLRHDARALPLEDESVDLIVTSPPYFALRSDEGEHYDGQLGSEDTPTEFIDNLIDCVGEWVRVLKPSGSMFINLGDKYAGSQANSNWATAPINHGSGVGIHERLHRQDSDLDEEPLVTFGGIPAKSKMLLPHRFAIACIDNLNLIVRMDMIWSKPNGLPESVTDRVRASHEYWFHLVKEPRYFSGLDEIREPQKEPERSGTRDTPGHKWQDDSQGQRPEFGVNGERHRDYNPLGRLPGSVWTIPTEPLLVPEEIRVGRGLPDHFAAFPQEWPRRLITAFSPVGYCQECGESRVPALSVEANGAKRTDHGMGVRHTSEAATMDAGNRRESKRSEWQEGQRYEVTGYTCQCPKPTAPTTPAVVLDPFGGTGTVAGVARTLGRFGVHNDLSADYNRLAAWRIFESGHFTKTEQRMWSDRQGQLL
jgi:DNA modification methylase